MRIPKPPKIEQMLEKYASAVLPYLAEFKATDEKGRYLTWDKFKRVNPSESEVKWLAVKLNRKALQQTLNIGDLSFNFCVPESLQAQIFDIDSQLGNIQATSFDELSKTERERFLLKSLMMEEAITSAQLEGAATTRKVAKEMLESARKPRTKDEMMIVNNYRLMKKVLELQNRSLNVEMILELHQIATENAIDNQAISGEFRADDEIYIADRDSNNIYQPPPHSTVPALMEAFCDFANQAHLGEDGSLFLHPVIKGIILHFLIGYIHPFGDGNGRTARALFYWFVLKSGYALFEYISISRLLKEAPKQYAMAYIHSETDDSDLSYFLYYQVQIIRRAINDLIKYVQAKQQTFSEFIQDIGQFITTKKLNLNDRQIRILQKAANQAGTLFSAKEISTEYGIAENTARADLKALQQLELLNSFKSGNTVVYLAPQDLLQRLKSQ